VDHDARPDEAFERKLIEREAVLEEVHGRVAVRSRVRAELELRDGEAVARDRRRRADAGLRIAGIERRGLVDGDAEVDDAHAPELDGSNSGLARARSGN